MALVRVESSRPARLTTTWLDTDGEPANPDSVLLTLAPALASGRDVVQAATTGGDQATADLAHDALTPLTRYAATWDAAWLGRITQDVATVSGSAFTLPELRNADERLEDAESYPAAVLRAARDAAMDALEDACGVAFAHRQEVEQWTAGADRYAGWPTMLRWPEVGSLQSLTIDGVEAPVTFADTGMVYVGRAVRAGQVVRAVYTHGKPAIPARVSSATLRMAVDALVNGPADDRVSAMRQPDAPFLQFVTAGVAGARFSTPEANAVVDTYRYPHRGTR